MEKLEGVYVIDRLEEIGRYRGICKNLDAAIAVIERGGFDQYRPGRNELFGDRVFANLDSPQLVKPADRKKELHHRHFDIQIPLLSDEAVGLARLDPKAPGSFDEARDCGFYEQEVEWLDLKVGEFGLFYPNTCLHAPACTRGEPHLSRKLVFKVKAQD